MLQLITETGQSKVFKTWRALGCWLFDNPQTYYGIIDTETGNQLIKVEPSLGRRKVSFYLDEIPPWSVLTQL